MGEVYRARDTRLDRDVAIEILPESFAQDADRLARFEREAKTLAALNHPNIAATYEMTSKGASHALVLEFTRSEFAVFDHGRPFSRERPRARHRTAGADRRSELERGPWIEAMNPDAPHSRRKTRSPGGQRIIGGGYPTRDAVWRVRAVQ